MIENCAALTIAGSDSGGGAGIQADLKTFSAFGIFGTSVITAITAQNLNGVYAIQPINTDVVEKQLLAVLEGFPIRAIKTGMLFSKEIIETIANVLSKDEYRHIPIVIDPVFVATSGSKLFQDEAIEMLTTKLFPLGAVITPNIPEAEVLLGEKINSVKDVEWAAKQLFHKYKIPVLVKGGHLDDRPVDVLVDSNGEMYFESEMVENINTHGSGCTLSSAIAAGLARNYPPGMAIEKAKHYIFHAMKNGIALYPGLRVIDHSAIDET